MAVPRSHIAEIHIAVAVHVSRGPGVGEVAIVIVLQALHDLSCYCTSLSVMHLQARHTTRRSRLMR